MLLLSTANSRLADLFSNDDLPITGSANRREFFRKLLTTHSFEVPAISLDINQRLFNALEASVLNTNGGVPLMQSEIDTIAGIMAQLLSPEVRRGEPMNLNRIFGDGVDNDGNDVFDEPGET